MCGRTSTHDLRVATAINRQTCAAFGSGRAGGRMTTRSRAQPLCSRVIHLPGVRYCSGIQGGAGTPAPVRLSQRTNWVPILVSKQFSKLGPS